ncbi:MAG: arylsulfatase [Acidobacteria bacterium]|nr:arylsulfatase [Acidobacteriota bacterium]
MHRREFLTLTATAAAPAPRPNIVYFLADDLGYGDVGYLNPQSKILTPNIDRLAAQGVRFTDAHDPTAVCTPTRYGILTGRYCWRSRLKSGVLAPWGETLIEEDRLTVPAMLRQHGYRTAAFGKWHLGFRWPTTDGARPNFRDNQCNVAFDRPVDGGPITRGFDYFFGVDCPNYPPYCFIENDRLLGDLSNVFPEAHLQRSPNPAFGPIDSRPGPMQPGWRQEDVLPELTRRAAAYIAERGPTPAHPFFLYFACTGPHTPIVPAPAFQGKSKVGPYGDFVQQVDSTLGRLLQALDQAGLARNTLVIFTSDNGPERFAYDRIREFGHYSMSALRGIKRDAWEGGHRVPFLARWPGRIPAGSESRETICQTDLMATAAAIVGHRLPAGAGHRLPSGAGHRLPSGAGEDSYDILPALTGAKLARPIREATVHHSASGRFAIRRGPWVLIDSPTGDDNREPEWFRLERGYRPHELPGELYDLSADPAQRINRYAEQPAIAGELKSLLEKYKREGRSAP